MSESYWAPHVTVAAVAERDGLFLVVEERVDGQIRYNQPAGHLDPGETVCDAVVRETREETGYRFVPKRLLGIQHWDSPAGESFLRFSFGGTVSGPDPAHEPESGILAVHWLSPVELERRRTQLRSPLVLEAVALWQSGAGVSPGLISRVSNS